MSLLTSGSTIATSGPSGLQEERNRVMLILCGLVASGKSTFAEALQRHNPHFRRCNQDELGDRHAVEQLARESLEDGLSVCIDRTNFNAAQRAYWIDIAREFPGTKIWVIVFDTPFATCAERLQTRTGHPTITSPAEGLAVLSRFAADFRAPRPHEGYERILFLQPADHPVAEYTAADLAAVLTRVRNAPPIIPPPPQSPGGRGRGGYGGGPRPGYSRHYGHPHRLGHQHGDALRGRGRVARGGGGHVNQYPVVYPQQEQQNHSAGGRGRGSYYGGAYRGDGVGLYGARPVYVTHSDTGAGSSGTVPPVQGSGSDAGTRYAGGRDDVLPIDD